MDIIYKGFYIDKEKEDFTNNTIYTVWDKKGIICLTTTKTVEEAKAYIDKYKGE